MKRQLVPTVWLCLFLLLVACRATGQEPGAVDYTRDIAPLLSKNCLACHNAKTAEGGLNLESHETLMTGGDSGDSIVPKDLESSYLLARVNRSEEPLMPPEDNDVGAKELTAEQLKLLERWILEGAQPGDPAATTKLQWQSLPEALKPIYALTSSLDSQFLAYGRGCDVLVLRLDKQSPLELVDPKHPDQPAHLDIVQSVAVSPDNQRIATGGYRNVKIWKRVTAPELHLSGLNLGDSTQALLSSDAKYLAYRSSTGSLEVVALESGQAMRLLRPSAATLAAFCWIDPQRILTVDGNGEWSITEISPAGLERKTVVSSDLTANSLTRIGPRFLGLASDKTLFSFLLEENQMKDVQRYTSIPDIYTLAVDSAGQVLAMATESGEVHLGSLVGNSLEISKTFPIGKAPASLAYDANAQRLLVTFPAQAPELWDVANQKLVATIDTDYEKSQHLRLATQDVQRQTAAVERMQKRLPEIQKASEKEQEALKKVQETRDKALAELEAKSQSVASAQTVVMDAEKSLADAQSALEAAQKRVEAARHELEAKQKKVTEAQGQQAAAEKELAERDQALAAAKDSAQRAADLIPEMEQMIATETQLQQQLAERQEKVAGRSIAKTLAALISTDGSTVVLAGDDQQLRTYSINDGTPRSNMTLADQVQLFLPHSNPAQEQSVSMLTQSGKWLSMSLASQWELEHSIGDPEVSPFSDRVTALDFSPDGQLLAVGGGPPSRFGEIQLVDASTGEIQKSFGEVHSDSVLCLRFSPDGRQLASGAADKLCKTFDTESGKELRSYEGHTHHILGLAWQDDGQVLATASADSSVKLWKAETGEQIRTISDFKKEVTALQFVGLSHQFVVADASGTVRLYNADDGKQVRVFAGADDAVFCVAVSSEDTSISAGGQAGKIWTWQLSDGKLLSTQPEKTD